MIFLTRHSRTANSLPPLAPPYKGGEPKLPLPGLNLGEAPDIFNRGAGVRGEFVNA